MKISYNWIKQFLKIDLPPEQVSEILTDLGLEVEGIATFESIKGGLKGVVVGEVLECEQHPNADRLRVTQVDLGNEKKEINLSQSLACESCGTVYPKLTPRHFSWNHPSGACKTCDGLGDVLSFKEELVI
ncbi:MAG: hypothetical protein ACPH4K_07845, partial [Flavobacteriaceae bacterium]